MIIAFSYTILSPEVRGQVIWQYYLRIGKLTKTIQLRGCSAEQFFQLLLKWFSETGVFCLYHYSHHNKTNPETPAVLTLHPSIKAGCMTESAMTLVELSAATNIDIEDFRNKITMITDSDILPIEEMLICDELKIRETARLLLEHLPRQKETHELSINS